MAASGRARGTALLEGPASSLALEGARAGSALPSSTVGEARSSSRARNGNNSDDFDIDNMGRERADNGEDSAGDLLKGASVYLDVPAGVSSSYGDAEGDNAPLVEAEGVPDTLSARKEKKSRASRAERLAAEQAVWVREKFDLPSGEKLIASFSAALVRNILIQGRIHITSSYLCFYAKIFGRVTKEAVPFARVGRVKKRRGGFVANAVKIYFTDDASPPLVIGSLNHRERAFSIIQARLQELNPVAAEWRDGDDTASGASAPADSEDRSFEEDDENGEAASRNASRDSALPAPSHGRINIGERAASLRGNVYVRPASDLTSDMSSRRSSDIDSVTRSQPASTAPPAPQLVWRDSNDAVDKLAGNAFAKRAERARVVLDAPVVEAFNLLFVSTWLRTYHDSTNNRDVEFSEWYRATDGFMTRDVTFRRPLAYKIGPKETRVNEVQRYSFTKEGGVILEVEGRNLDAPYGDYFVVESFFEMKPTDNGTKTLLTLSVAVHFNKSTILRGKIESGAMQETKKAFQKVADLASCCIDEYSASKPSQPHLKPKRSGESSNKEQALASAASTRTPHPANTVIAMANSGSRGAASMVARPTSQTGVEAVMSSPATFAANEARGASAVLEVQDAMSTRWLRVLGIAALLMVCLLLLTVTVQLHRMQSLVSDLEKLILFGKEHATETGKCTAQMCAAAADSV